MLSAMLSVWMLFAADPVSYQGRLMRVVDPGTDSDGFFPKGEAKVCVEGQNEKDCYRAPERFGRYPELSVVDLRKDEPALFFQTASGGVSGYEIHFALLKFCDSAEPLVCKVDELTNFFPRDLKVSDQSQHVWWEVPAISDSKIFLTANYEWGPREAHHSEHRFIVSAYVRILDDNDELSYHLVDRFMTVKFYGRNKQDKLADIIGAEKQEILMRLKRAKASWAK